jgi:hypothetical protein
MTASTVILTTRGTSCLSSDSTAPTVSVSSADTPCERIPFMSIPSVLVLLSVLLFFLF